MSFILWNVMLSMTPTRLTKAPGTDVAEMRLLQELLCSTVLWE